MPPCITQLVIQAYRQELEARRLAAFWITKQLSAILLQFYGLNGVIDWKGFSTASHFHAKQPQTFISNFILEKAWKN